MSTTLKLRGGSTAEHSTFTGEAREVTVDTQKNTVVVHDGSTVGGHPLLKVSDIGTASTANIGTDTGEVIGTDEAKEYFGLNFEPSVKPTIASDFSSNDHKLYEQYGLEPKTITQMYDVARASTATYVDATGKIRTAGVNEPRIDYSSGQGRLLVEEARTNLQTQSNGFIGSGWSHVRVDSISDSGMPSLIEGVNYRLVTPIEGSTGNCNVRSSGFTPVANMTYSISVYISDLSAVRSASFTSDNSSAWGAGSSGTFNLDTGVSTGAVSMVKVRGGYRVTLVITSGSSVGSGARYRIFYAFTSQVDTLLITGAQLEQASTPSSYIPTEASAVTRAADTVSRVLGDEFNKSEWAVFVDFDFKYGGVGTPHIFSLSLSNTSSGRPRSSIRIGNSTGGWQWQLISDDESKLLNTDGGLPNFNQGRNKLCYSYKNGAVVLSLNGQAVALTPAFTDKTFNNLAAFWITTNVAYSVIDTRIYPKYLPEQECIQLTKV